jgi:two-component system chemotaxis response regulator CheY
MARILIVDDDELVRQLLRDTLEPAGYEVMEAQNGREGLQRYRAVPADLVITDILMPAKDGLETIQDLRRDFPTAKIIALSGSGQRWLDMARQCGAQQGFEKPFRPQGILAAVQALLPDLDYDAATV